MLIVGLMLVGLFAAVVTPKHVLSMTVALAFSILTTVLSLWALLDPGISGFHGTYLALNPLRSWFLLVVGTVSVASAWYRFGYRDHHPSATSVWLPLFQVSMVGVICAENVWVFMTAWEMMSLTSFFLVLAHPTGRGVLTSAYVYLVMSQFSAMAILSGLLLMATGAHSMNFTTWSNLSHQLPLSTKSWIFALLGLGFAVKSGVVPFHVWLPRAHPIAPAPVSALMSGAMIKLGIFGILQFLLVDVGPTSIAWPIVFLVVGAISSVLGILYALMEPDLKRLLAYSSIENVGIIFLGLGIMALGIDTHEPSIEMLGLLASLLHTLNHAIYKSQLFLVAGAVEQHTGTLHADSLGGLIRSVPGVAIAFLIGAMAISGLPPWGGFISEWVTFRGLFDLLGRLSASWTVFALLLALVLALTSASAGLCFVKATGVIFLGEPRKPVLHQSIPLGMQWPTLMLSGLSLALGIFPASVARIAASVMPVRPADQSVTMLPVHVAVIALLLVVIVTGMVLLSQPQKIRVVPRWSCGRIPDASMQFTSASFTKAVRTTLAFIYRPHRHLTRIGENARYFPERLTYTGGTTPIWERYLYEPVHRIALWLSHNSTKLQAGSVQLYLTYLLAAVGAMLLIVH